MPNRILKDSICTSPNIDALSREAEVFFYRLLVQCDDYGRMDARPAILRAKCYPLQVDTVSRDDIRRWFAELVQAELITPYSANGGDYLQMRTWERHQQIRAKRSKYPDMIASDINCNQMIADAPVIQSNTIHAEAPASAAPAAKPSKPKPTKSNGVSTAQQEYFGAVCACVGWDSKTITADQKGQVAQTAGVLQGAGYSIDDLRSFWRYWRDEDWRGQKGQLPTLPQLRSEIGKIRAYVPPSASNGKVNGFALDELLGGA